jgi:very-short-patch-repair endonuclease
LRHRLATKRFPLPRGRGSRVRELSLREDSENRTDKNTHHHLTSDQVSIDRRRALRRSSTEAERSLWRLLRGRQLFGAKFRRQESIGPYFLDFYCASQDLAIELDGGQHYAPEAVAKDAVRTELLQKRGIRVLRFSNRDILIEPDSVVFAIMAALRTPSP